MSHRFVLVVLLFLAAKFTWALPNTGANHSSTAVFSGDTSEVYRSANQPNRVAATTAAKQQCEQARGQRQGYCEIISVDGTTIGRAIDLKPNSKRHPLFLWRYTQGQSTVYLAGTVHVLKEGFFPLPQQYEQAFQASDKLVVEAAVDNLSPEEIQQKMLGYALLPDGSLRDVLAPETYAQLRQYAQAYGLPLEQLQSFNPALVSQQLSIFAITAMGYDPALGMEAHFSARIDRQNLLELESVDAQLELLLGQPLPVQKIILRDTLAEFDDIAEQTNQMLSAWASGDDAALAALVRDQTGTSAEAQQFLKELLDDRNTHMAARIAQMLNNPGRYFVLVGSAHLAGEQSVITELRKHGFYGKRIFSNDSSID